MMVGVASLGLDSTFLRVTSGYKDCLYAKRREDSFDRLRLTLYVWNGNSNFPWSIILVMDYNLL